MMRTEATAETIRSRNQRPRPPAFWTGLGMEFISGWPKGADWPVGGLDTRGTSSSTVCIAALTLGTVNPEIRRERSDQMKQKQWRKSDPGFPLLPAHPGNGS